MFTPQEIVERATRALAPDLQGRPESTGSSSASASCTRWAATRSATGPTSPVTDGYKAYQGRLREVLAMPPRYWLGWSIADELLVWYIFRDLLPAPVQDHVKNYWRAWLQPDLETSAFLHSAEPRCHRLLQAQSRLARPRRFLP